MDDHPDAGLAAFADESFHEDAESGFYVLAAVIFESGLHEEVRELMRELLGRRRVAKLHWNEMDRHEQESAAKRLASIDGMHGVVAGSPVPPKRQERARACCLRRLVFELRGAGVEQLVAEARTTTLDLRDVRTVSGARFELPMGKRFRIRHRPGHEEPLLWAADIVAGAVRANRLGRGVCRAILDQRLYEIEVETGC